MTVIGITASEMIKTAPDKSHGLVLNLFKNSHPWLGLNGSEKSVNRKPEHSGRPKIVADSIFCHVKNYIIYIIVYYIILDYIILYLKIYILLYLTSYLILYIILFTHIIITVPCAENNKHIWHTHSHWLWMDGWMGGWVGWWMDGWMGG